MAAASPSEEIDSGGRGVVGELKDLVDEVGSGDYSGAGERRFDVVRGGVGEDFADDAGG